MNNQSVLLLRLGQKKQAAKLANDVVTLVQRQPNVESAIK